MAKQPVTEKKQPSQPSKAAGAVSKHPQASTEIVHQSATFEGPMPPPAILEGYERLVPGAAERILAMAESDTKHQHAIEFAALHAAEGEVKRGQIFAFVIGLAALLASMFALYMGSPAVAGIIGGTTVVGLVSVFIIGRFVKSE
jgi:uncharacterized membrane protein